MRISDWSSDVCSSDLRSSLGRDQMTTTVAQDVLASLAGTPRLLVALDFDGTLAPLENEPMDARMLPVARRAVERLAALPATTDRKSVVQGTSVSVRVDLGGRRSLKKKKIN